MNTSFSPLLATLISPLHTQVQRLLLDTHQFETLAGEIQPNGCPTFPEITVHNPHGCCKPCQRGGQASHLLPIWWVAVSFSVSVAMTATAPASSGLVLVVLGGSNNHFFCQMALVIPSVGNDVIFGGGGDNGNICFGWVLGSGGYSGNSGIAILWQFKVFGGLFYKQIMR